MYAIIHLNVNNYTYNSDSITENTQHLVVSYYLLYKVVIIRAIFTS